MWGHQTHLLKLYITVYCEIQFTLELTGVAKATVIIQRQLYIQKPTALQLLRPTVFHIQQSLCTYYQFLVEF